jgi:hypothetical protein
MQPAMQLLSWRYELGYHALQAQQLALDLFTDPAVQAQLQVRPTTPPPPPPPTPPGPAPAPARVAEGHGQNTGSTPP